MNVMENRSWQLALPMVTMLVMSACSGGGSTTASVSADSGNLKNLPETYSVTLPKSLLSSGTTVKVATKAVANPDPAAVNLSFGYQRLQGFSQMMEQRQGQIADQFVLIDNLWDELLFQCQSTVADEVCGVDGGTFSLTYTQSMADAVFQAIRSEIMDDDHQHLTQAEVDAMINTARSEAEGTSGSGAWPRVGDTITINNRFEFTTFTVADPSEYKYALKMVPAALDYTVDVPSSSVDPNATPTDPNAAAGAGTDPTGTTTPTALQLRDFRADEQADFSFKWSEDHSRVELLEEITKGSEIESYQYSFVADAINGDSMTVAGSKEETEPGKTELKEYLLTIKKDSVNTALNGVQLMFEEKESKTKTLSDGSVVATASSSTMDGQADDNGGFLRMVKLDDEEGGVTTSEHQKEEFDGSGALLIATFCSDSDINDADGDICEDPANWQTHDPNNLGGFGTHEMNDSELDNVVNHVSAGFIKTVVNGLPSDRSFHFELYIGDPNDPTTNPELVGEGEQRVKVNNGASNGNIKSKVRYWGSQLQLDSGEIMVYEVSYDPKSGSTTWTLMSGASISPAL